MKFKIVALPLMVCATSAAAESYQSITNAQYTNNEFSTSDRSVDIDEFDLDTTYYFAPRETLGPLKEFDYINKITKISAGYSYLDFPDDDANAVGVGGEYFATNGFVVGGGIVNIDETNLYNASVGYLFSPNFLLSVERTQWEDNDADYLFNARYNHQLSDSGYIGFDFSTDDDLESRTLSSKLFKDLGGETWITASASFTSHDDFDDYWKLGTEYYFSRETSVFADYDRGENFGVGVSHFFNRNISGKLAYNTGSDTAGIVSYNAGSGVDTDTFLLGLTVQL
ncbi:putative porin [Microbulbifer sp. TYP-18]|uniref:putative porin n=1 Tax=Microbulbifer sp. TYP-18 TaxID=3230024 RepID=UPI0034C5C3BE